MGLKRGFCCKATVRIMFVLKQSSEESVWMKEGSDRITMAHSLCRDSSVGIGTRCGLGRSGDRIPVGDETFSTLTDGH